MCGIGGCIVTRGDPSHDALRRMAGALGHRGPDDQGIEIVGRAGLVHTRLAIVDPSPAGHEPMGHPDRRLWLTYNGEVFNHADLRRELGEVDWRGGSDAETVLHALAAWGTSAVARFNGLFAFAVLDLDRHRLLLVRDRFGVKPLYYARRLDGFWFASEIGALLAAGQPRQADAETLLHATRTGWANGPETPIQGVRRLRPGAMLSVSLDDLSTEEELWYSPSDAVDPSRAAELERLEQKDVDDLVEGVLGESVRRRLMADVPVGTMCSGGLDSSLTTYYAAEAHPRILAFNASVLDQPEADEGPWAEKVARGLDIELCTVPTDATSWRRDLVDVVRHVEYPLTHESSVPMWQIADLARQRGVKVLLSGEGADELFGGYTWVAPWLERDFTLGRGGVSRALRGLLRWLRFARADLAARRSPGGVSSEVTGWEKSLNRAALQAYRHHRGARRNMEASLLGLLGTYLPHLLNRQDKTTMKASIETREPFLDPDLVEVAVNLPLEQRMLPTRKAILRRLARRHLPEGVADRPKVGFGFDLNTYLVRAARPEFLLDGILRDLQGVSRPRWAEMVAQPGNRPLPLWTAEIWARLFLEGESAQTVHDRLWRADASLGSP
jgi:asparagine synthase (glutamine-hydrolysing)